LDQIGDFLGIHLVDEIVGHLARSQKSGGETEVLRGRQKLVARGGLLLDEVKRHAIFLHGVRGREYRAARLKGPTVCAKSERKHQ